MKVPHRVRLAVAFVAIVIVVGAGGFVAWRETRSLSELHESIDELLHRRERAEMPVTAIEHVRPEDGDRSGPSAPPPIDLAVALRTVDGDRQLLAELGHVFAEDCPSRLQALRDAVASGDDPRIERAAHTVKGALASLGAQTAATLASQLEAMGCEPQLAGVPATLDALEREMERVRTHVGQPGWVEPLRDRYARSQP